MTDDDDQPCTHAWDFLNGDSASPLPSRNPPFSNVYSEQALMRNLGLERRRPRPERWARCRRRDALPLAARIER